jgi:uncharacterized protein (TIGR00369 family)
MTRTRTFQWSDPATLVDAAAGSTGLAWLGRIVAGELPQAPISAALDFALVLAEHGHTQFRAVPAEYHYNPFGTVHGGFVTALLDSAMLTAVLSTLDAKSGVTTAQLSIHLTRPITAATGPLVAEGRVVHVGSRLATGHGELRDERGNLLAHATTMCLVLAR